MRFGRTFQDCLFLIIVVLISLVLYVGGLGFYSDDWAFLGALSTFGDLGEALQLAYLDPTLRADVVTPKLDVREDGIFTSYGGHPVKHPYSERLLIYDYRHGTVYPVSAADDARRYFDEVNPDRGRTCPPSTDGAGSPVLPRLLPL
jgi:hypothetical protein